VENLHPQRNIGESAPGRTASGRRDAAVGSGDSELNQHLAKLYTQFNANLLSDENDRYLELKTDADLAGLPQSVKDAAAEEAYQVHPEHDRFRAECGSFWTQVRIFDSVTS